MVWWGSLRAALPVLKPDSLTLGQSTHLHWPSSVVCAEAAELAWHARVLREALELFFEPSPNRKWALITSMVDFYCKQVNAIDFVSAVTCKN